MTPGTPSHGQLKKAIAAGFPPELLIAIAPPSAPVDRFPDTGKAPCIWHERYGWTRAKEWQKGFTDEMRAAADAHGCNAGLLLGVPSGDYQFLALDLDTEGDDDPTSVRSIVADDIRKQTILGLGKAFGNKRKMWIRLTRPGRASFLIALPSDQPPGAVATIHLSHPSVDKAGKMQVLARGQQTVLGGIHPWKGHTPIRWRLIGGPSGNGEDYPTLDADMLFAEDRPTLDAVVEYVLAHLAETLNVTHTRRRSNSSVLTESETVLPPEEQAAWDAPSFVSLFVRMPHNKDTDRDDWVAIMHAASGCIKASVALGRVTDTEADSMANAAKDWSARWKDPKGVGTTLKEEEEKWDRDFSLREVTKLGWRHLLHRAIELGDNTLRLESAVRDFPDTVALPDKVVDTSTGKSLLPTYDIAAAHEAVQDAVTKRREKRLNFDVKQSEIQIADALQDVIGRNCAWIADEKKWIMWRGPQLSWSDKHADALVRQEIQNELVTYAARNHEHFGDNDSTRASLTSERCVRAIDHLLQSRLSVTHDDLDRGDYIIQTPGGAWDLQTGRAFGVSRTEEQRTFKDRRLTLCAPKEGHTPLFDALLDHLSCGDPGVVDYLWSYAGYALIGQPKIHNLLIIQGPGTNGKSTIASVFRRVFGSYAEQIDRRVLVQKGESDHQTGLYQTRGKRLWCVAEINPNERWNEAQIRTLSGGDPINARGMRQDTQTFRSEGTFLIYTQFVPALHRVDEAIIRRFRMLHARLKIPDDMIDRFMEDKIVQQEGPAILARLIREAKAVIDRNWTLVRVPNSMQAEIKRYFSGQDTFHSWFSDECQSVRIQGTDTDVALDALHERYRRYIKANSDGNDADDDAIDALDIMSMGAFKTALKRVGVILTDDRGKAITGLGGKVMARGIRMKVPMDVVGLPAGTVVPIGRRRA